MSGFSSLRIERNQVTLGTKLLNVPWSLILILAMISGIGVMMLYSAASGSWDPWAKKQAMRFAIAAGAMLVVSMIDIRFWYRHAYGFYVLAFGLLVGVEVMGEVNMGAQRWLDLGVIQLQPSEVMKVVLVLTLARYFHERDLDEVRRPFTLVAPIVMVMLPVALVMRQPDLGTALLLLAGGGAVFFLAGVRLWKFAVVIVLGLAAIPVGWQFLHDYQKNRVLTFLDPSSDPLGTGYHILQSKIALGSGGVFGKGFLNGSQSHLNFLPEKQTDFIFTMLAEEFGMLGGIALITLYALVMIYGFAIALRCRHTFGRLLALGLTTTLFLYVFINVAMVMGLIPVVGVPLPLISYGGTAMLTLMVAIGMTMCVHVHRDMPFGPRGGHEG